MKKIIFTSAAFLLISSVVFSQERSMLLKDGGKATLNIITYTNPLIADKKFLNAKEDKKDEQIAAFNAGIAKGTTKPASNYNMVFNLKKTKLKDADEYSIGYTVAGKDYFSYLVSRLDTVYQWRNRGPVAIGGEDNPIGYVLQGPQILPVNLKVGDVLPSFEDISIMFPTNRGFKVDIKVFDGWGTKTSSYWGYGTDSRTGESGTGNWEVTKPIALYKTLRVDIRETATCSGHAIHYMNAVVTGEEEMTVSGTKYKAFIIESESWSKAKVDVSYESAYQQAINEQQQRDKMANRMISNQLIRRGFTNKQGYSVMYSKEWFVPQIGIVKTIAYDIYGGISTVMITTGVE